MDGQRENSAIVCTQLCCIEDRSCDRVVIFFDAILHVFFFFRSSPIYFLSFLTANLFTPSSYNSCLLRIQEFAIRRNRGMQIDRFSLLRLRSENNYTWIKWPMSASWRLEGFMKPYETIVTGTGRFDLRFLDISPDVDCNFRSCYRTYRLHSHYLGLPAGKCRRRY